MPIHPRSHHTSFPVRDVELSRNFYEGVLGLVRLPRPDFGIPGMWLRAGEGEVHLIEVADGDDVGTTPGSCNPMARHAAFAVDDYVETVAHLKAHGLEVFETTPAVGQCWVQDPDGHVIELLVPGGQP